MTAYYNEIDPYAAQWLRNLIDAGHIAPGIVDERSIEDVYPSDLRGFTQCHFFAGIGGWSIALRQAGVADDAPIWTGSCPCQPFATPGRGDGFADERHLWPAWQWLIAQCQPPVIVGEQVAGKDADPWIDLVCADLEGLGYPFRAVPFPAASVGTPGIRDRIYWVADSDSSAGRKGRAIAGGRLDGGHAQSRPRPGSGNVSGLLGNAGNAGNAGNEGFPQRVGFPGISGGTGGTVSGQATERASLHATSGLGDPNSSERQACNVLAGGAGEGGEGRMDALLNGSDSGWPGPVNGFWRTADWLLCRDGKWRPVESGSFPLVDGPAARLGSLRADWHTPAGQEGFGHRGGRLKGYGNAINAEAACVFIECVMEQTQ